MGFGGANEMRKVYVSNRLYGELETSMDSRSRIGEGRLRSYLEPCLDMLACTSLAPAERRFRFEHASWGRRRNIGVGVFPTVEQLFGLGQ